MTNYTPNQQGKLVYVNLTTKTSLIGNDRISSIPVELAHLRWYRISGDSRTYAVELTNEKELKLLRNSNKVVILDNDVLSCVPSVSEDEALLIN